MHDKNVIETIFPNVQNIGDYVTSLSCGSLGLLIEEDLPEYSRYIQDLYIEPEKIPNLIHTAKNDTANIKQILYQFVADNVRSQSGLAGNENGHKHLSILTLGYRLTRWTSEGCMRSDSEIECYFINTVHSYILNSHWQTIANRVGESVVRRVWRK